VRKVAVDARDVGDHTAAVHEVRQRRAGRPNRAHEVQLEDFGPVRVRLVGEACPKTPGADVVDEDVERAEACDGLVDRALGGIGLGHVQPEVLQARDLRRGRAARAEHADTLGQQRGCARQADPLTRTGDERSLAVETEIHGATLLPANCDLSFDPG
jgi:hypothetical protein